MMTTKKRDSRTTINISFLQSYFLMTGSSIELILQQLHGIYMLKSILEFSVTGRSQKMTKSLLVTNETKQTEMCHAKLHITCMYHIVNLISNGI